MSCTSFSVVANAGRDGEMASVGGKQIGSVSVAINCGYGDRKAVAWVKVKGFEKTAQKISEIKKGDRMWATGSFEMETYRNKAGVDVSVPVLLATRVQSLAPRPAAESEDPWSSQP